MRLLVPLLLTGLMAIASQQAARPPALGVVSGVVVDRAGAFVAGANVDLAAGQRVERSTSTSARGEFQFEKVPAGSYDIRVTMAGFAVATLRVTVGEKPVPTMR